MADDYPSEATQDDPGTAAPAAPPAAPAAPDPSTDRVAALERQLHELNGRNQQYETIVTNLIQGQTAMNQGPAAPIPTVVSPQARQYLRSRGQTDEEIDANAGLIGPYLDYAAQTVITPLAQENRKLQERLDKLSASTEYEDWDVVKADVDRLALEAQRRGEPTDLKTLYAQAVVSNFDRVAEARSARRAAATTRANDASALSGMGGSRAVLTADTGGPMTSQKFLQLSPDERARIPHAERQKLWNELAK
jgi:hypothetical protein